MNPGDRKMLRRMRRWWIAPACLAPLTVLGGAWWAVDALLTPAVPGPDAPAAQWAEFIAHERGLPRQPPEQRLALLQSLLGRFGREAGWGEALAAALRRLPLEQQMDVRRHVFDAVRHAALRDIGTWQALGGAAAVSYLDDRIVEYNRLLRLLGPGRAPGAGRGVGAAGLEGLVPDRAALAQFIASGTSERERAAARAYADALARRVEEILADPQLRATIEAKIAAP